MDDREIVIGAIRVELLRMALKISKNGDLADVLNVARQLEEFCFAQSQLSTATALSILDNLRDAGTA
jgi:predicted FMN-binding regulatory protein PaiB